MIKNKAYLLTLLLLSTVGCVLLSEQTFEGTWKQKQNILGEQGSGSTTTFQNGVFEQSSVSWSTGMATPSFSSHKTTITGNYTYKDDGDNKYTLTISNITLDTNQADLQSEEAQQAKIEEWSVVKLKMVDDGTLVFLKDDGTSYEAETAMYLTRQ